MGIEDILKLALGSGVIAAIVNQGITWFMGWKKESQANKRLRIYSALRIATLLEAFAINCRKGVADAAVFSETNGDGGIVRSQMPELEKYPQDVEWKIIDSKLCASVLSIPNEVNLCQMTIDHWLDEGQFDDHSGAFDEHQRFMIGTYIRETAKCGLRAWEMAKEIRKKYKLPTFDPKEISGHEMEDLKDYYLKKWEVTCIEQSRKKVGG